MRTTHFFKVFCAGENCQTPTPDESKGVCALCSFAKLEHSEKGTNEPPTFFAVRLVWHLQTILQEFFWCHMECLHNGFPGSALSVLHKFQFKLTMRNSTLENEVLNFCKSCVRSERIQDLKKRSSELFGSSIQVLFMHSCPNYSEVNFLPLVFEQSCSFSIMGRATRITPRIKFFSRTQ